MSHIVNKNDSPLLQLPNTYRPFYGAFPCLRPIQKQTIAPLLEGKDLILQSATGSGKTEAVLAPCTERIIRSGRSEALLYIVPTRALTFDLKRRFDSILTQRLGLRLGIRTGDIKRAGGGHPDLILTTPESLDVMLGSSNADLQGFLSRVRMLVIDEVHPFVYQYRGRQLSYLLKRLERRSAEPLQKIALSATIADMDAIIRFFRFRHDTVRLIENVQREIIPHLIHLKNENDELIALLEDLYNIWKYRKILIFANSRGRCDQLFALTNRQGSFRNVSELHYSNLRTKERRDAEHRFRRRSHSLCVATSTLELGIDVGDVDAVLLYEPPDSVSAFLQRIGRSNRRGKGIHFWGVCRGERAGEQLLRFLGLLRLAREGAVESPLPKTLPSVLAQQIISCLYEKKRISLPAIEELFSEPRETLDMLFTSLKQRGWLRKTHLDGLFQGGWRYRNCLFDRQIWSNFPEMEEDYTLELSGEAIADLPKSVVRQLDPGDRIHIAGKRLQVLEIDEGEHKRVLARPTTRLNDKEIVWVGSGFFMSYDVAQSISAMLKSPEDAENESGLFTRTRKLLQNELNRPAVVLANGIEVVRGKVGFYRYRTFLGSVGNLILKWAMKETKQENLYAEADEIGVECSHWISFEELRVPVNRKAFCLWAGQHFKMLIAPFSLNSFCSTLPPALLIEELTDFLYDSRIARAFSRYLEKSSEIVSGDPGIFDQHRQDSERETIAIIEPASKEKSLLDWEKKRWAGDRDFFISDAPYTSRPLTGTIIGEYFRHQQCERWFNFYFLPGDQQPPRRIRVDEELAMLRTERGRAYERFVLDDLKDRSEWFVSIEENDLHGTPRGLKERFEESVNSLRHLIQKAEPGLENPLWLSQGVFILSDNELSGEQYENSPAMNPQKNQRARIGIPDLIRITYGEHGPLLEVGDIKSSSSPRYYQKWQVAFYALLLKELVRSQAIPAEVADTAFLLTPGETAAIKYHNFDIRPYTAAFPALFKNLARLMSHPAAEAIYQLQQHCATCDYFEFCYTQALATEDIQFLPQLTRGELWKLRDLGLKTMDAAGKWFETSEGEIFSPHQRERIEGRLSAFQTNRIALLRKQTRVFPKNISAAIFVHIVKDPVSLTPCTISTATENLPPQIWNLEEEGGYETFSREFVKIWHEHIEYGKGPHIVHFGMWTDQEVGLFEKLGVSDSHRTDIRQMIRRHFDLPAPGSLTFFAMSCLLGLKPRPNPQESLFHPDEDISPENSLMLLEKLWRWALGYLESEWDQESWDLETENTPLTSYLHFVEEERHRQEEDIIALQEYNLEERVERFRAIGPLIFLGTMLDEEGRFLYNFKLSEERRVSKFREGDFLKLARVGVYDLQSGFSVILANDDQNTGQLSLLSRQGRLAVNKNISYSLEEDASDWNTPKLLHAVHTVFSEDMPHPLFRVFSGQWIGEQSQDSLHWARNWLRNEGAAAQLNTTQQHALELPFHHSLSMIEGPPGTGKTYLLGWILIALIRHAREERRPLRIAVSALTHHAIDQVLKKVVQLINECRLEGFPGRCVKWGRWNDEENTSSEMWEPGIQVESCDNAEDILASPYLIMGATGYGLYGLFQSRNGDFPRMFDWVIFDEASQILVPQALLSLIYGKGKFLFLGDVRQLPPIVIGDYEKEQSETDVQQSVLGLLLNLYGPEQRIRLDMSYRMNREICEFPSRTWYDSGLCPAPGNADSRLTLNRIVRENIPGESVDPEEAKNCKQELIFDEILDPEKPVVLVLADHHGAHQESETEAEIMAQIAFRLISTCHLSADQLALISPHRAQNNTIRKRLSMLLGEKNDRLPLIDTVERVQGAERDVVIFGFTSSDADHVMSRFLNNPNRFNVAITRARHKLIVVGSRAFFSAIPHTEKALHANQCFKAFFEYCQLSSYLLPHHEEVE